MNDIEHDTITQLGYSLISEMEDGILDHFNSTFFLELLNPKDTRKSASLLLELVNKIAEEQQSHIRSIQLTSKMNEAIDFINVNTGSNLHHFISNEDDIDG